MEDILVKKRDIILLARAYSEKDESMFTEAINNIVKTFQDNGDEELANFLNMMVNDKDRIVPMEDRYDAIETLRKLLPDTTMTETGKELDDIKLLGEMLMMIIMELGKGARDLTRGKPGSTKRRYIDAKQKVIKKALEQLSAYSMDYAITRWFGRD